MQAKFKWQMLIPTACCVFFIATQPHSTTAQTLKFEHLTVDDGLTQGSVEGIIQDNRGFIWFCTRDGLNRYDGRGFKTFKHDRNDEGSLSNNFVRQMVPGRASEYWIATKYGLNRFDPDTERFTSFHHDPADPTSLSSDNIMRVLLDHAGTLWVGTWGGGLNSLDEGDTTFSVYATELDDAQFARGNIINAIVETRDHTLWVAAITGLYSSAADRSRFVRHELADDVYSGGRDNIVVCFYEGQDGTLWLGTYTGLIRYQPRTGEIRRYPLEPDDPKNVSANQIRFIVPPPTPATDQLWIGTASRGLILFDTESGKMTRHRHNAANPASIAHNALWSAFEDRGGTMWIGTAGRGVDKISPMSSRFEHFSQESVRDPGLNSNSIWSFCEDRAGNLWLGTDRGLSLYHKQQSVWRSVIHVAGDESSIGDGPVYSILEDRRGRIWFATGSAGLSRLAGPDKNGNYGNFTFEHFRNDPDNPASLSADRLFSLYEDRAGRIWIGTVDEGVDVYTPGTNTFAHFRPDKENPNSISENGVECIYQDSAGIYWFGTLAGGLNRLDYGTRTFRHYKNDPADPRSLSSNHVTCIIEDAQQNLWIATADGLNRLHPDQDDFDHYFEADGAPNSYIYGLVPDAAGDFWLSTNYGLARFRPETATFRNFTTRDGLQANEFNAGAFYRSPRGELFFGGHNGFNRFTASNILDNPNPPPVVLTSFQIRGRPAPLKSAIYATEALELSYRDYSFSFEFASLDFWAPERNRYQHMMVGLDDEWVDAGNRNFVNYTHLDPGSYVFRVRASNGDGVWNQTGVAVPIRITPPFWKRLWFLGLASLVVALAVYNLYRYRVRRLLEIERLRTRISADLHDDIANNLSSIATFSGLIEIEQAADNHEHSAQLLTRIRELAEDSVGSIRDIIWAINPATETLSSLLLRLRDRLVASCRIHQVELRFEYPALGELPDNNLAPEQRQHLWLLFKEVINNTFKHAQASQMTFSAEFANNRLNVSFADDGCGFDMSAQNEGNGLITMRMRAQKLGGELTTDSGPGRGTTVRISVPI